MMLEKFLFVASSALEYAKMVTIITTNTAVKMATEGRKEVVRQYHEYKKLNGAPSPSEKNPPPLPPLKKLPEAPKGENKK